MLCRRCRAGVSSRSKHKVILLLASLLGFVGTQGLFCLSTLTPGFNFNKSLCLSFQNHSWILSASADKTVKLWDALQIETGFSTITVLCSSKIFTKGGKSNIIDQQTVGSSLTLTGHFMKVPKSFLHCNVQSTIDYIFQTIKGHLCPS